MTQFAIFVQEGFGADAQCIYFTHEAPRYEAENIPVFARVADTDETVQVGEREETFVYFTPLNGPSRRRGKVNRVPFQRVLSVTEQEGDDDDA